MERYLLHSLCWLCCLLLLAGCSRNNSKKALIGFSLAQEKGSSERWQKDHDYFVAQVESLGGEVISRIADSDDQQQLMHVRELIAARVNVLVLMPNNSETAAIMVEEAHKAGISVIAYDRIIKNCPLDYYISFNNVRVGELQAAYLINKAPRGNYVLLGGAHTDFNSHQYREGQMNLLDPLISQGKVKILMDKFVEEWRPMDAYLATLDALSRNGNKVDAVLVANDALAGGVVQALQEKGLAGKVLVSGQDADLTACRRLLDHSQTMTVYKSVKQLASQAAQLALDIAAKRGARGLTKNTFNGYAEVPTLLLDPVAVAADNLETTVVADGYHRREEIFDGMAAAAKIEER